MSSLFFMQTGFVVKLTVLLQSSSLDFMDINFSSAHVFILSLKI